MNQYSWLMLVISLPANTGTQRMRVWRALKARGAGILRDGVYVLPDSEVFRKELRHHAEQVQEAGGSAYLLDSLQNDQGLNEQLVKLFDRSGDYESWLAKLKELSNAMAGMAEPEARRREAQLRKEFDTLVGTDYFPGEAQQRASRAVTGLGKSINQHFSPDEPHAIDGEVLLQDKTQFQNRTWATRQNLWVDRVASAWLIRRFIDKKATFKWLEKPVDCPGDALGFDFDEATFTHIGDLVTFEVLLHSFSLDSDKALKKLGVLIHYLDVGGVPVAEADGFVAMLAGVKQSSSNDDVFLKKASVLLDSLYAGFSQAEKE